MRILLLIFCCVAFSTAFMLTGLSTISQTYFGGGVVAFSATLNGNNLNPPIGTGNGGTAACLLNVNVSPYILSCQVCHDVTSVSNITLNFGGRGGNVAASALLSFTGNLSPCGQTEFYLTNSNGINVNSVVNYLYSGLLTINVLTINYPNGIIGGQLGQEHSYISILNAQQEVDDDDATSGSFSNSNALGVGIFDYNTANNNLQYTIYHGVSNVYKSGLYAGDYDHSGSLQNQFVTSSSPVSQTDTLSSTQESLLYSLHYYVNIKSSNVPRGEIRGQVIGGLNYVFTQTGVLSPLSGVNTQASGIALFAYDCNSFTLEYYIQHDVLGVKSIGIYDGSTRLFSVPNPGSPSIGTRVLSSAQQTDLMNSGGFTVRIESNAFPHGELSGSVNFGNNNYAGILNGGQVVPPVTTPNSGAVVLNYLSNREVTYSVVLNFANYGTILGVDFVIGDFGVNGVSASWTLNNGGSNTYADATGLRYLNDAQLNALFAGQLYVQVRTTAYPQGEIRGQVTRLFGSQCTDLRTNSGC